MPLQILLKDPQTQADYHFSPARDIAYLWPKLVELAYTGLLESNIEDWLGDHLKSTNVSPEDAMRALVAYSKFLVYSVQPDLKDPYDALLAAGWFDCPLPAQLVVCAKFGQLCTGSFWAGIRAATPQGVIPADIETVVKYAKDVEEELSKHSRQAFQQSKAKGYPVRSFCLKVCSYVRSWIKAFEQAITPE